MREARFSKFESDAPAAGELHQVVPIAGERQLEHQADHAVVVILDLSVEAFTGFEDQGLDRLLNRRALVANVAGGMVLEAGIDRPGAKDLAQVVEANLFANIKLDQDQGRPVERRRGLTDMGLGGVRLAGPALGRIEAYVDDGVVNGVVVDGGYAFAFHEAFPVLRFQRRIETRAS